jgi:hypothetical protein
MIDGGSRDVAAGEYGHELPLLRTNLRYRCRRLPGFVAHLRRIALTTRSSYV